ncbi:hypothetical protein [Pseudomonas sp.]|uniref:hypothetical protein n=1 Tax=Pseudomonas sp. TaxID=306 RepID=UPI0028A70578|nr:hypothetical protein [Pseudomonas sp.]
MTNLKQRESKVPELNGLGAPILSSDGAELKLENEILIRALHETQENLERAVIDLSYKQREIRELSNRLNQFLTKYPNHWEAGTIQTLPMTDAPEQKRIRWEVSDTYVADKLHSHITFETFVRNGIAGLKIFNSSTGFDHFILNPSSQSLDCMPATGSYSAVSNQAISCIGRSDWKAVKDLLNKVKSSLNNNDFPNLPDTLTSDTINGLDNLKNILDSWPDVLRYDSVDLTSTIDTPEYQALDLSIKNLEINGKVLPEFCYRISSVNEPGMSFGQYPRLEFSESSRHSFEQWFSETEDQRGKRLELRFADPDQMDINVWKKIHTRDQLLIAANITKLPEIFKILNAHRKVDVDWGAWEKLAIKLKTILTNTLKTQKPSRT